MDSEVKEEGNKPKLERAPKWLRQLQLHSWEPEILLSGIVLYGLFQTPELLDKLLVFVQVNLYGGNSDIDNLVAILKVAIYWLTLGLILHLISRGIWVGMVGLSFTFPKGINIERLHLSPKFKNHLEKIPSIQSIIISLEKLCSSLFSISFMLFMCMIGGYFFFLALLIIPLMTLAYIFFDGNWSGFNDMFLATYVITLVVIALIGLIDFVTLGFIKRFKWLSRIYWPIYRFISILTLSRLYRPIYYSIVSNFSKWKISIFLIAFVSISFKMIDSDSTYPGDQFSKIELWNNSMNTGAFSGYYDDQNSDKFSQRAHIQSDIIRGNTIRLFVVSRADLEDSVRSYSNYDSLVINLDTARHYINLHAMKNFYHVYIDDSLVRDLDWRFHYKSQTGQKGILTWIGVSDLDEGLYSLRIAGPDEMYRGSFAKIPFYREFNTNGFLQQIQPAQNEEDPDYLRLKPFLPK
jgi:hypothetical protein